MPNEPPLSGGVSSRSRSPCRPSAAAATPCSVNGPWKFAHAVSLLAVVPVGDDAVALDRRARAAREAEVLAHDEVGAAPRRRRRRRRRSAVVHHVASGCDRVEHGVERVVVDLDELGRVLRDVAVTGDDDRDRLADVAHGVDRRGVLRDAGLDPSGKRARQRGTSAPVSTPMTPGAASAAVASTSIRAWASGERTIAAWHVGRRGRDRRGTVPRRGAAHRPRPAAAPADPGRAPWSRARDVPRRERTTLSAVGAPRRAPPATRQGRRPRAPGTRRAPPAGSRPWRSAAIVSGSRTAPPQWAHGQ